jgi:hypothetical protein
VRELVDVLRHVLPQFAEQSTGIRNSLVLASASTFDDEPEGVEVALVAWPQQEDGRGTLGPDQGLWEEGQCTRCKADITSNAKRALCPVCSSVCQLT